MTIKIGALYCILLSGLVSWSNSTIKTDNKNMETQAEKVVDGARAYQKNYTQFKYFIETIGMVTIDEVKLNNEKLTAIYSYKLGNEVRHVVSELNQDKNGIYKGTCTTKVNGKILFSVNTWLTFSKNGTATGNWSWSGNPSKNDPVVTISKS